MGLKELFSRWSKKEDQRAIENAKLESDMTPAERATNGEDFEARKEDLAVGSSFAGSGAEAAASDDPDQP
jgi:hypothetical protein